MIQSIGLKDFGKRIRTLREKHSYSQGDMANILSISRTSYLAIEQGKRDVGLLELQKIAAAFQMHLEVLLHGGTDSELQYKRKGNNVQSAEPVSEYVTRELIFNKEKCKSLVLYMIQSVAGLPHAMESFIPKLLYLVDFAYFENHEQYLSTCTYKKLPFGPLPDQLSQTLEELLRDEEIATVKVFSQGIMQNKLIPLRGANMTLFMASEIKLVDEMVLYYGRFSAEQLAEILHLDVPMKVTGMGEVIQYELTFYREFPFAYKIYCEEDGGVRNNSNGSF